METVGGYELIERLPTEGMSEVWEAFGPGGHRAVLKRLGTAAAGRPATLARARDTSPRLTAFDHPAFVRVQAHGEDDGRPWVALGRVGGQNLRELVRATGPLELGRLAAVVGSVAAALDGLDLAGVTYADAKTGNVLVTPGRTVLAHSWLSLPSDADPSPYLDPDRFGGTIDYVAPEVIEGGPPTLRSDVYGLGCLVVECVTQAVPFARDSEDATLDAHLHEPPPPTGNPGLDRVLARAMAKDPGERHATAGALAAELAALAG